MVKVIMQQLEDKFYQKIIRYNDLIDCLKRERACLADIDLERLWDISFEKEEICVGIKSLRQEIMTLISSDKSQQWVSLDQILVSVPEENRERLKQLTYTINRLKAEIETLRKENIRLVDHSLQFIDEIISIIAGQTQTSNVYNQKCRFKKPANNMLLCKEV
jgi:hypothetical protein